MSGLKFSFIVLSILSLSGAFTACSEGIMGQQWRCGENDIILGFKVSYDSNKATSGSVPVDDIIYQTGDEVIIKGNPGRLINGDLCLKGWYVLDEGVETYYTVGNKYRVVDRDLTLTAFWVPPMPGYVDTTFEPAFDTQYIDGMTIQKNGKILIFGGFKKYDGIDRKYITRIYATGILDTTFDPSIGPDDLIKTVKEQDNGKIIITGRFTSYNGIKRNGIARLNSDGTLDDLFNPGDGPNNTDPNTPILVVELQNDGKILIGGNFTSYNGVSRNHIARLHNNGSLDLSFNPGLGPNAYVTSIKMVNDEKILIGGQFWLYDGNKANAIVRINNDGSLDNAFNSAVRTYDVVYGILVQADRRIIINGHFQPVTGEDKHTYVYRLNNNGSIDNSFEPCRTWGAYHTALQNDGKIIIGGSFTKYNSDIANYNSIVRINADGTIDETFDPGNGACGFDDYSSIYQVVIQENGKIFIIGDFIKYNDVIRPGIVRIWN